MAWINNATITSAEPFAKTTKILYAYPGGSGKAMCRNDDSFITLLRQGAVLNLQLETRVSKFTGKNGEPISDDWVVSTAMPSASHAPEVPAANQAVGNGNREASIVAQSLVKALYANRNGATPTIDDVDHIVRMYLRALNQLSAL